MSEAAVEFLELRFSVRAGHDCNGAVGMKMVDMRKRQKCVQRRVDGCRRAAGPKRAQRIECNHLVFELLAAVHILQLVQLVHVEQRETGGLDAAEIAAASLDG